MGYFPSDYAEMIPAAAPVVAAQPPPPPKPAQKPSANAVAPKLMARALYEFKASNATEMSIKVGEVVEVVLRGPAGGWCKGLRGAFPTNYVEFLPQNQSTLASTPTVNTTTPAATNASRDLLSDPFGLNSAMQAKPAASNTSSVGSLLDLSAPVTYTKPAA